MIYHQAVHRRNTESIKSFLISARKGRFRISAPGDFDTITMVDQPPTGTLLTCFYNTKHRSKYHGTQEQVARHNRPNICSLYIRKY